MSEGLNRVHLLGNLGAEPELRLTQAGTPVMDLRLATNEVYFDKDKVKQTRTEWHTVTVWGARADGLAKILHKGECVLVEGRIQTDKYDKDGATHYRTKIIADNIVLVGGRGASSPEQRPDTHPPRSADGREDF